MGKSWKKVRFIKVAGKYTKCLYISQLRFRTRFTWKQPSNWWFTWSELNNRAATGKLTEKKNFLPLLPNWIVESEVMWPSEKSRQMWGASWGGQKGKSGKNGFALIWEVLKLWRNKGRFGTLRFMINKAICNLMKNKMAAESVLFLTSFLNHWKAKHLWY